LRKNKAFTLAELLLAVGLISIVVLTVLGLGISVLSGTRKSIDTTVGQQIAEAELQRSIYQAEDSSSDPLWSASSPSDSFQNYTIAVKSTSYAVALYAQDLYDSSTGLALGNSTFNKSKKVDARVTWWNTGGVGRTGYGLLQASASQVIDGP
jgi:Tfp pilus assembly protein PilV